MLKQFFLLSVSMIVMSSLMMNAHAGDKSISNFKPGQEWTIKSDYSTTAKVIIGRVERWGTKTAVHVSIVDIPIPQGMAGAGSTINIGHVAFEESALASSVGKLVATDIPPASSFESGYKQWEAQQGDLTDLTVSQTIEYGLTAMKQMRD